MKPRRLWATWLASIGVHGDETYGGGVAQSPADSGHLRIFPIEEAQRIGATVADLAEFLRGACGAYSRLAAEIGVEGWFYAWVDEMSGTLRCNISRATSPKELPFTCRIEPTSRPEAIAEGALSSRYTSGIPLEELEETEWSPPEEDLSTCVLPVYVARLLAEEPASNADPSG